MKILSRMLWIGDALRLARTHNRNRHLGEQYAVTHPDEPVAGRGRVTRRYKVVCAKCKEGNGEKN